MTTSYAGGIGGVDDNAAQAGYVVVQAVNENRRGEVTATDVTAPLSGGGGKPGQGYAAVCITGHQAHTLTSEGSDASEDGTGRGTPIVVALDLRNAARESSSGAGTQGIGVREGGPSFALSATERAIPGVADETIVRRLTELECERLQGYPDGWTAEQSGSARYRQLGNSIAVPVFEWLANRLVVIDGEVAS